jgi:2-desacetyl-2-hydroxyethyl bacteriochlorophyllide A dehydrogenase
MTGKALWTIDVGVAELRQEALPKRKSGEAMVRTLWSGLSRGTERLVFNGLVPPSEYDRMRAPMMAGQFPFPVKYGYAAVGEVVDGPTEVRGATVFCLHPHQDRFTAPAEGLSVVPSFIPPRRAVLTANMETALNALWDSGAGPGDRIVVVGAGVVGLLIARLAARMPGAEVSVIDVDKRRSEVAHALQLAFLPPDKAPHTADVVFHASASPQGLATAIDAAGLEARVVEVSWYGACDVPAPLGGAFHSQRLKLMSTQVGQVSPTRRPRWDYARRRAKAIELLDDPLLDCLITDEVAFDDLPAALPHLLAAGAPGLQTVIRYC